MSVPGGFNLHDRVRWTKANPDGWAGEGIGKIMGFDSKRPGFGTQPPSFQGPAFLICLDGDKRHTVWVEPDEIVPHLEVPS